MVKNNILVSVIIPTYNRAHTLKDAINSVIAQTYTNYEIILVDDGSTDDTNIVISHYGNAVKYYYQQNNGPSSARNTGIKLSKGELIAFLDSDDVWREDKLARQVDCFSDAPNVGIVASGHEIRNENWEVVGTTLFADKEIEEIQRKDFYKNFFSTPSVVIRSSCLKEVGYFDETITFAEDWDMWLRVLKKYNCLIVNEPLVSIRISSMSLSNSYSEKNIEDLKKIVSKHGERIDSLSAWCTYRKRWGWYYMNRALVYRDKNWRIFKCSLVKSILWWPFWYPGRYLSLIK